MTTILSKTMLSDKELLDELTDEFGKGALSSSHPHDGLSLRQCQQLLNKHGFDKGKIIVKRWKAIYGKKAKDGK